MSTLAAIALGGNLGNVPETFELALAELNKTPGIRVLQRSSNYRTRAIGGDAGSDYINAAALLEVDLDPLPLLRELQRIENELGRVRTIHWGPRTLDLDMVSYGENVIEMGGKGSGVRGQGNGNGGENLSSSQPSTFNLQPSTLSVPHPACWYRRFVLDPWVEIAPDWKHPILGESVKELQTRLLERPLRVLLAPDHAGQSQQVQAAIERELPAEAVRVMHSSDSPGEKRGQGPAITLVFGHSATGVDALRKVVLPESRYEEMGILAIRAALDSPQRMAF